jgi:hypothetical protein
MPLFVGFTQCKGHGIFHFLFDFLHKVATNIQGKLKFEVIKMTFTWGHVHLSALTSK